MRKRLPFYCYFLPLLLGAGAWWFVSWVTTPRPLWTRSFVIDDFVVGESLDNRIPNNLYFTIAQDQLSIRLNKRTGYRERIEILTGKTVSRIQYDKVLDESNDLRPKVMYLYLAEQTHVKDRFTVEAGISTILQELLPRWEPALSSKPWVPDWMKVGHFNVHLRDRNTRQILLTAKGHACVYYFLTNQWFIVLGLDDVNGVWKYRVQAYALPTTYWPSWYAVNVGLGLAMVFWILLRRAERRMAKPVEPWRITFHEQQV